MTSSIYENYENSVLHKIDAFVQGLENDGFEFEHILDTLLEYVDVCDDVFAK